MKIDLEMTTYVDIEVNEEILTKEVMDNYERYFHDVSNDSTYDGFHTQLAKHVVHIAKTIANNNNISDIEGYGSLKHIIKNVNITTDNITAPY